MSESGPSGTWLVMHRELTDVAPATDMAQVHVAMVLDVADGRILGVGLGDSTTDSVRTALERAPGAPDRVLCEVGLAPPIRTWQGLPAGVRVEEVEPGDEAEDLVDSLVGHLAGRRQPEPRDQPTSEDWSLLYAQAHRYAERRPWERWTSDVDLRVHVRVDEVRADMIALVLGHDGVQRGLVLYPGVEAPEAIRQADPGVATNPPGTIALYLETGHMPSDLAAKASRYGWPADAGLRPIFAMWTVDGAAELGAEAARQLTVALAAVLDHDAAGPRLALGGREPETRGELALAERIAGEYRVVAEPTGAVTVFGGEITFDPALERASLGYGGIPWAALPAIREQARVHVPAEAPPEEVGEELPIISIDLPAADGEELVAHLAAARPLGVAIVDGTDEAYAVLLCDTAAFGLLATPLGDPELQRFRRQTSESGGIHAVLIVDLSQGPPGVTLGLIECRLVQPAARSAG